MDYNALLCKTSLTKLEIFSFYGNDYKLFRFYQNNNNNKKLIITTSKSAQKLATRGEV